MYNSTHYWFSFTSILGYILLLSHLSVTEQILLILWIPIISFISLIPNIFDKYFCKDYETQTCVERCRHPITHSPYTFFMLILILTLVNNSSTSYKFIANAIIIAWGTHLLLDMFSQEGIPLGFVPTLFTQDPTKNYVFNESTRPRMRLHVPTKRIIRDDSTTNKHIRLLCKIAVFYLCVQLLLDLKEITINFKASIDIFAWEVLITGVIQT